MEYLLRGIKDGFRIGFRAAVVQPKARKTNMPSVLDHPEVVTEYIKEELQANRMHWVDDAVAEKVHCIHYNDGIDKDLVSLTYVHIS